MPASYGMITTNINLTGLAAGTNVTSDVIDNTSSKFDAIFVMLQLAPGVVRPGAFFNVGILPSLDGINFGTYPFNMQEITGLISSVPHVYTVHIDTLPPHFKIVVQNRSGAGLSPIDGDNLMICCGTVDN